MYECTECILTTLGKWGWDWCVGEWTHQFTYIGLWDDSELSEIRMCLFVKSYILSAWYSLMLTVDTE